MTKKLFLSLIIIIPLIAIGLLIYKNLSTTPQNSSAESLSPTPISQTSSSIDINGLRYSWYEIANIDKLKLIPNFTEKLSSKEIIDKYGCQFLSNGPFYSKENQPLGLFITNGNTLYNYQNNSLLDGVLSINNLATPRITRDIPQDHLQIAVQSGPLIKENNNFINLKIQNDKDSRRVLAAVTGDNKLFFLVIYNPASEFSGPMLADIPNLLSQFEQKTKIIFADIINLDGGSASTFVTSNLKLYEFNSVGAFFCQP